MPALIPILLFQLLMETFPHVPQLPSHLLHQRIMPPLTNGVAPVEKPLRHLIRARPPPVRVDLLRLHVFETGLFEVGSDLFGGGPVWARDQGRFEARVQFFAGVGPGDRDAGVGRVGPGGDAEDTVGGGDAVEFADAGGGVVGEVNDCSGEGVRDSAGRDVWVGVSDSVEPFGTRRVHGMNFGRGKGLFVTGVERWSRWNSC